MESSYQPPVRKSLSDEELAARVNLATSSHSGIEAVMVLLVAQEQLRAQEDAELAQWVTQMENDGSPEALRALENHRRNTREIAPVEQVVEVQTETEPEEATEVEAVTEVEAEEVEEKESSSNPFSWFTRTKETPVVEPADEIQVVEEAVIETPVAEELVVEEVIVEEIVDEEPAVEERTVEELIEEVRVSDVHPEGSETVDAFDQLLAAASAEEELTALEDAKEVTPVSEEVASNVTVPSDEHRDRKPLSQLFIWLGASATLLPIVLVAVLIGFGLSASAVLVDLVVGYLVSGVIIGVAALGGKRSGLSTSVISRAVFGVWGNSIPLTVLFIARAAITALVLSAFTFLLDGLDARIPAFDTVLFSAVGINLTVGFLVQLSVLTLVGVLTLVKGLASRTIQLMISLISVALVIESFLGLPFGKMSLSAPGNLGIFSKESIAGMALVIMATLTLWIGIAPNLSKSIPMKQRGFKVFGFVLAANFVAPAAIGVVALFWLGNSTLGLIESVAALPRWSSGALVSGLVISLIYITLLNLKTASLDLVALLRLKTNGFATLLSFVSVVGLLFLFAQQPDSQRLEYLVNVFVFVSALLAGWIGMFVADVSLRRIAYHELSLTRSYGFYKKFNWLSIVVWFASIAVAVALIPVNLLGFSFFGFALPSLGLEANLGSAAIGFAITVLFGALVTVAARIPQVRKQEREVLAVESRREQLNDIFVGQD
jgi:purine-cytosine permease-like protein